MAVFSIDELMIALEDIRRKHGGDLPVDMHCSEYERGSADLEGVQVNQNQYEEKPNSITLIASFADAPRHSAHYSAVYRLSKNGDLVEMAERPLPPPASQFKPVK